MKAAIKQRKCSGSRISKNRLTGNDEKGPVPLPLGTGPDAPYVPTRSAVRDAWPVNAMAAAKGTGR